MRNIWNWGSIFYTGKGFLVWKRFQGGKLQTKKPWCINFTLEGIKSGKYHIAKRKFQPVLKFKNNFIFNL